jgi:hypothetical protein
MEYFLHTFCTLFAHLGLWPRITAQGPWILASKYSASALDSGLKIFASALDAGLERQRKGLGFCCIHKFRSLHVAKITMLPKNEKSALNG